MTRRRLTAAEKREVGAIGERIMRLIEDQEVAEIRRWIGEARSIAGPELADDAATEVLNRIGNAVWAGD